MQPTQIPDEAGFSDPIIPEHTDLHHTAGPSHWRFLRAEEGGNIQ